MAAPALLPAAQPHAVPGRPAGAALARHAALLPLAGAADRAFLRGPPDAARSGAHPGRQAAGAGAAGAGRGAQGPSPPDQHRHRDHPMNASKTAIVVGAGFGGLALAIRLQASGIQTTLLEKRDKPGGRAYVYEDQGFVFDAGPTVITDPSAIEEWFTAAGKRMRDYVELLPVAPFYRLCWEDGSHFDYANDQDALDRQIHARNPQDV